MLVDVSHAVMERRDFDKLPEYSCTLPTGTTIGKRWKRSEFFGSSKYPGRWFLGEYVPHDKPERVGIQWREILIVDNCACPTERSCAC